IHKEFNVKLPLAEIFRKSTIRGLAEFITECSREKFAAIEAAEQKEYYLLTSAQKRLFVLQQMKQGNTAYNMPCTIPLAKGTETVKLENVFRELIRRHDSLRTTFHMIEDRDNPDTPGGGAPVLIVQNNVQFNIEYNRLEAGTQDSSVGELSRINELKDRFFRPFDLSKAPLLRVAIIEITHTDDSAAQLLMLVDMHHIITDGTSQDVLLRELFAMYRGETLAPLRLQYSDYAEWRNSAKQNELMKQQEEFWVKQFSGELPVLTLPTDHTRPVVQRFEGSLVSFMLTKEEARNLKETAKQNEATLYMTILSIFSILLSKLSGQEDIIVGTPTAGRRHADLENIIGMFVNTLAIRIFPGGGKSYRRFLMELKSNTLEVFENQEYPFEDLVEGLSVRRDTGRNPIFDVMFNLLNQDEYQEDDTSIFSKTPVSDVKGDAEQVEPGGGTTTDPGGHTTSKFDLTLFASENDDNINLSFEYCTDLFKKDTVRRFAAYFKETLRGVSAAPTQQISEIEIITREEKNRILYEVNDTTADNPQDKTIHQLVEEQAEKSPHRIAVTGPEPGAQALTYRQLNETSNRLARVLRAKGVGPDRIVGIMVERSQEMVIGLLAILKAGGAYLPIAPETPEHRVRLMLNDCNTPLLLTLNLRSGANLMYPQCETMDITAPSSYHSDSSNPEPIAEARNIAYVIYTSGTSGIPKGTLIVHHNVIRVVKETNYIEISHRDVLLQLSNYAFDGSTFDIYGALLNGARLVLIAKEMAMDVTRLAGIIGRERISVFFVTTALFNTLVELDLEALKDVRKILFGGEKVSVTHVKKALGSLGKNRIIHVYGPTESTVYASYYHINQVDDGISTIPIGRPLKETAIYVLSRYNCLQPVGVAGELCIAGNCLSRGYLNRPELTAEKFVPIPGLAPGKPAAHGKLKYDALPGIYKTGDLCRLLPDGNIEFLGRIDLQVKIRGFRIELAEIEARLLTHPEIKEAVVLVRESNDGDKLLCAYYIVGNIQHPPSGIRTHLSKFLPDYMIPTF
ncbi:MAG: amino acid adenylation domain-containing protein, partial [bacterium]|nr:amino acid adenylation domain-containing protein [bacterium]